MYLYFISFVFHTYHFELDCGKSKLIKNVILQGSNKNKMEKKGFQLDYHFVIQ